MRMKFLLMVFFPLLSFAQTAGIATPWDTAPMVAALSAQAARLKPILDQLTPKEWVAKGAPDAYIAQWKGAEDELVFLADSAKALEKQPERLAAAMIAHPAPSSVRANPLILVSPSASQQVTRDLGRRVAPGCAKAARSCGPATRGRRRTRQPVRGRPRRH